MIISRRKKVKMMLKGFKNFILKGNVVDMAVGVVIGVAFGSVVTAMVKDLITPLIGIFGGTPDFSAFYFTINSSKFMIGEFINSLISFLSIAIVIYFAVVMPMNKVMERIAKGKSEDPTEKTCPECLSLIPLKAKRCKYCTAVVDKRA
ncbi:MAG TPA: large conductance mechanosensitive channel protein MscL [Candidatus Saccharimonadales bacterium]|jgi:large conductance mechanosensitive channel|nr:large conductance mechanosensitive channel protein MscL [Candidatus Saccharimonadales bacterium]